MSGGGPEDGTSIHHHSPCTDTEHHPDPAAIRDRQQATPWLQRGSQEAGGLRWRERWDGEGEARRARTRRNGGIIGDEHNQHACRGETKIKNREK